MAVQYALMIPVRSLEEPKTRLASHLSNSERSVLMTSLVKGVITAAQKSTSIEKIYIVSGDMSLSTFAREHQCEFYFSEKPLNEALTECSESIDGAGIVVAHGDLASIDTFDEITSLLTTHDVVLCPDRHRVGTNIVGRTYATAFQYQFGHDSFARHLVQCRFAQRPYAVVNSSEYSLDIDTQDDLNIRNVVRT